MNYHKIGFLEIRMLQINFQQIQYFPQIKWSVWAAKLKSELIILKKMG